MDLVLVSERMSSENVAMTTYSIANTTLFKDNTTPGKRDTDFHNITLTGMDCPVSCGTVNMSVEANDCNMIINGFLTDIDKNTPLSIDPGMSRLPLMIHLPAGFNTRLTSSIEFWRTGQVVVYEAWTCSVWFANTRFSTVHYNYLELQNVVAKVTDCTSTHQVGSCWFERFGYNFERCISVGFVPLLLARPWVKLNRICPSRMFG
jgi:hypothetical protein